MNGPFSWESFPPVQVERWINGSHFDLFQGSHSGYSKPNSPIVHRRQVFHPREDLWFIRDVVEGQGDHELEVFWHPGSGLAPAAENDSHFSDGSESLDFLTCDSSEWSRSVREFCSSPVYGKLEPGYVVCFKSHQQLPAEFVTIVLAGKSARRAPGKVLKLGDPSDHASSAYRFVADHKEYNFVFGRSGSPWQLADWNSDAEFVFASLDHARQVRCLVFCNGTHLAAGEKPILSCARAVRYAEVWSLGGATEVSSSDPGAVSLVQNIADLWPEAAMAVAKKPE